MLDRSPTYAVFANIGVGRRFNPTCWTEVQPTVFANIDVGRCFNPTYWIKIQATKFDANKYNKTDARENLTSVSC